MIGIIGAMPEEVEALQVAMRRPQTQTVSGVAFVRGMLENQPVVVARSGIGKVFAALCAQTMILTYRPRCIINTGVAGGLIPSLKVGDVAVAESVVQYDFDTSAFGDPVGLLPGFENVHLSTDPAVTHALCDAAEGLGLPVFRGVVASGDRFLQKTDEKQALHRDFGAVACEMEGAAIGQTCTVNQVPFGIVRVLSDSSDGDGAMEYAAFKAMAAARSCAVITRFCKGEVKS